MYTAFLNTLHDPAVRDLAWVLGSPGLVESSQPCYQGLLVDDHRCNAALTACSAWLTSLDQSPLALHDFIGTRPTRRLGHYFETLISYWLMHTPDTLLIASNLQVQHEQRTLGEYDFLFRNAAGEYCHWEVAIKFYLQVEPVAEQRSFIGPGTRDRLDIKLDKIFQQQLLLGSTSAGLKALPCGIKLTRAEAFIKGYLFYHHAASKQPGIPGVSPAHLSGWWVRHSIEKLPQASASSRWIILPRMRWLAPALLPESTAVLTDLEINCTLDEHFSASLDALLVIELSQNSSGTWNENSRGFVVNSRWPDITQVNIETAR